MDRQKEYEKGLTNGDKLAELIDSFGYTKTGVLLTKLQNHAELVMACKVYDDKDHLERLVAESILDKFGPADDSWLVRTTAEHIQQ